MENKFDKYLNGFTNGHFKALTPETANCSSTGEPFTESALMHVIEKRINKDQKMTVIVADHFYRAMCLEKKMIERTVEEYTELKMVKRTYSEVSLREYWEKEFNLEFWGIPYKEINSDTFWCCIWGSKECWGSKGDGSFYTEYKSIVKQAI